MRFVGGCRIDYAGNSGERSSVGSRLPHPVDAPVSEGVAAGYKSRVEAEKRTAFFHCRALQKKASGFGNLVNLVEGAIDRNG